MSESNLLGSLSAALDLGAHKLAKLDSLFTHYLYLPATWAPGQSDQEKIRPENQVTESKNPFEDTQDAQSTPSYYTLLKQDSLEAHAKRVEFLREEACKERLFISSFAAKLSRLKISFARRLAILPLEAFDSQEIIVKKQELREREQIDLLLAKSRQLKIPVDTHECRFILRGMDNQNARFVALTADSNLLCKESMKVGTNVYYLSPIDILSGLILLFPHLHHYTVILHGEKKHAVANYHYGALHFCAIADKRKPLDRYYHLFDDVGEVFSLDLAPNQIPSQTVIPLGALLSHTFNQNACEVFDTQKCLKILVANYLHTKSALSLKKSLFFPKKFYDIKRRILLMGMFGLLVIILNFAQVIYLDYLQRDLVNQLNQEEYKALQEDYEEKKSYQSVYHKIYDSIEKNKSLNFSIQQGYNKEKKQWE